MKNKNRLKLDAGRRRYLSWGMDFDSRSAMLSLVIREEWADEVKAQHRLSSESIQKGLIAEFGEHSAKAKLENFIAINTKPLSVLSHHNALYHQIREAFVIEAYYPALVGACALGERILNHLILDMRPHFSTTSEYKKVYRKDSFDDWHVSIDVLEAWKVLLPETVAEFRALVPLRNRSIHFNLKTYGKLREDALSAVLHMRTIIEKQFGSFGLQPWFIRGTKGNLFIRKDYEDHPFVSTYFLPNCPFVGPYFGMEYSPAGWKVHDRPNYGEGSWTDDEFAEVFNNRDPALVVQPPLKTA